MTERVLLIPDVHVPRHNRKAVAALLTHVEREGYDRIVLLGDLMDTEAPARWSRATAAEYAGTLQAECDATSALLANLRNAADDGIGFVLTPGATPRPTPIVYLEGNHEKRIRTYLERQAPAFADLRALTLPELLDLDKHGIRYVDTASQPYRLAPGWLAIHGDRLSQVSGQSVRKEVDRFGQSVVIGHCHRAGIYASTKGGVTRWGMECGHLSDVRQMSYLMYGEADWQTGWGELYIDKGMVTPRFVPVTRNGDFHV